MGRLQEMSRRFACACATRTPSRDDLARLRQLKDRGREDEMGLLSTMVQGTATTYTWHDLLKALSTSPDLRVDGQPVRVAMKANGRTTYELRRQPSEEVIPETAELRQKLLRIVTDRGLTYRLPGGRHIK